MTVSRIAQLRRVAAWAAFAVLADVGAAHAATFVVNNNGDAGDASAGNGVCATAGAVCTLRAAVQEANALGGTDTITIPAMTITLGSQLRLSQSVTINGAGRTLTFINANSATRAFFIARKTGTYTISGMTVQNGFVNNGTDPEPPPAPLVTAGHGGAIYNESILTLTGVDITNSSAAMGGGIFNMYATVGGDMTLNTPTVTINTVTITGCASTSTTLGEGGGGIFNGGLLTANGLTISNSTAAQGGALFNNSNSVSTLTNFTLSGSTAKFGGGIDNDFGTLNLNSGTISGNTSICCFGVSTDTGGGGIYNNEGSMTLTDVTVRGNNATSPGGYGAGLYNYATMTLVRTSVTGNATAYGSGIYNGNFDGATNSMTLTSSTVSGNIGQNVGGVQSVGGGIYNTSNGQLTITNSTIAFNSAFLAGGIENNPSGTNNDVNLRNSILSDNIITFSTPDCRGDIGSSGNNLVESVSGCTFFSTTGDQTGVDPRLLQLRGSPAYHPLRVDSPAFQTGNNSFCPATDQRGVARPQGVTCDKGAFEIADMPVVGDWDGNGTKTAGIFRPWEGVWYLRNNNTSGVNEIPAIQFGIQGDIPVVGDWNGDGFDTIGVYRPSTHVWYLRNILSSGINDVPAILFGTDADLPVTGDWDGNGATSFGVYRAAEHVWYLRNTLNSGPNEIPAILFGTDGDLPLVGDWNGDNMHTIGVFRPSERIWYLRDFNSSGNNTVPAIFYGDANDHPLVGDWNNDVTTTIGVMRPTNRQWFLRNFNSSGFNDVPTFVF